MCVCSFFYLVYSLTWDFRQLCVYVCVCVCVCVHVHVCVEGGGLSHTCLIAVTHLFDRRICMHFENVCVFLKGLPALFLMHTHGEHVKMKLGMDKMSL